MTGFEYISVQYMYSSHYNESSCGCLECERRHSVEGGAGHNAYKYRLPALRPDNIQRHFGHSTPTEGTSDFTGLLGGARREITTAGFQVQGIPGVVW